MYANQTDTGQNNEETKKLGGELDHKGLLLSVSSVSFCIIFVGDVLACIVFPQSLKVSLSL